MNVIAQVLIRQCNNDIYVGKHLCYIYIYIYIYMCVCVCKEENDKFYLYNLLKRNDQEDFSIKNSLACLNPKSPHPREGKLWTYTYLNNAKAQLDNIYSWTKSG